MLLAPVGAKEFMWGNGPGLWHLLVPNRTKVLVKLRGECQSKLLLQSSYKRGFSRELQVPKIILLYSHGLRNSIV